MGVLTIVLEKVTNLRDEDGIGKSDPYVKFELEQDNLIFDKGYGKKESTKKKNVLSPEYDETFEFPDIPSLNNMVLRVKIMDDDIGLDTEIGSCKINLEHLGLTETPKTVEEVVDKKSTKGSICHPCKLLCACCFSLFKKSATIHLKLSYSE
jgi:Ca2+-dependent lipid-binding protein